MKPLQWAGGIGVALLLGGAIGCSTDVESGQSMSKDKRQAKDTPEAVDTPAPRHREAADPDGRYELTCDYDLGDFGESGDPALGYRFIAGGSLENTGNIGIVVKVTYSWRLLGQGSLKESKTYRLKRGRSRDVDITIPVTDAQIDAHQSAHGDCKTKVDIVDTFGRTPYED